MRTVKLEGFKELERALADLPRSTAQNAGRRALMKAADPIDEKASSLAPVDTGRLERSVITGVKLTRSQRAKAVMTSAGFRQASKNYVEIHVGTAMSRGIFMEFGTFKDQPQSFIGPAWDQEKHGSLSIIKHELGEQIEKAAARYARKLSKGR